MFSGADSVNQAWLRLALWGVVAIVVVVVYGSQHLSREHRKQEEEPVQPGVSTPSPRVVCKSFRGRLAGLIHPTS